MVDISVQTSICMEKNKNSSVIQIWAVQIVVIQPLKLFHLKLFQTSITLSSCAQEKVLRYCFKIDLYFAKTFKDIFVVFIFYIFANDAFGRWVPG